MKQNIKNLKNLVKKTIFKVQNKTNNNFNIKNFNNFIKKSIFKIQNKTNNNLNISNFNKYLISFIVLMFVYLFYLSLPILYDKTWLQANIENKLLNEFKIDLSTSSDITYRILPAPHFLIKNSKIFIGDDKKRSIVEIKDFQLFLKHSNFFNKKKLNIKKIIISNANFSLLRNDLKLLNHLMNKKFLNKKIKINNSKIFLKDDLDDIISIIKVDKTVLFYDEKKQSNFLNSNGKIFNVPFIFDFNSSNHFSNSKSINLYLKPLKLNIYNQSTSKNNVVYGKNNISFLRSSINTKYDVKKKLISFKSDNSRLNNSQTNYTGNISINPFDLNIDINFSKYKISNLFKANPVLIEFIKSGVLFNKNISVNSSINIQSNFYNEIFQKANINFLINNGKISFDKTLFTNNNIGTLKLLNSNLFYQNNNLIFSSDLMIDIKDTDNLFSFLNTKKSSRKDFKTILINFDYNFLNNRIDFNNFKIDNNDTNSKFLKIMDDFNNNNISNLNNSRRLFNKILSAYAG
jgi:hypothetical protein